MTGRGLPFIGLLLAGLGLALAAGCQRAPATAAATSTSPTLRLYVLSTTAGAIEPCGCQKDMLGGIDHAAAFLAREAKEAPHALVLGAGPLLFPDPKSEGQRARQDLWKAEALAKSLAEIRLTAWAPGGNDWAAGEAELVRLASLSGAALLAGNLKGQTAGAAASRVVEVNGQRIGIAGVSDPTGSLGRPDGVEVTPLETALGAARADLAGKGAQIFVALLAADRGRALRALEKAPGFHVAILGKAQDQGEGNDPEIPPSLVDGTLVVQARNHLQNVVIVDLFVRGPLPFRDATGIEGLEKRASLTLRVGELERRVALGGGASDADVAARRRDIEELKKELGSIRDPAVPEEGSYFRYRSEAVREHFGVAPTIEKTLSDYYRRVNEHNKQAFAGKLPPAPAPGHASYIGAEACSNCHDEAYEFWKTTGHFRAYDTLVLQHKQFNLDCVSCHVTGYEKPGGTTVTHVKGLTAVQCEVCHGPGSRHEDDPTDTSALVRSPPKTLCAPACHHPPHVGPEWNADEAWKKILGKGHGEKQP